MPELPEVETIVRDLKPLSGGVFDNIVIHDTFVLRQKSKDFIARLHGQRVETIYRRGKAIIMGLSSGEFLVVHLMMTGQMIVNGQEDKHTRISFIFKDGTKLFYKDQRRFGQLRVVARLEDINYFKILGPEPFDKSFTPESMFVMFKKSSRPIKNLLLDHTLVAGIGNIYACEILFRSQINPKRLGTRIKLNEAQKVHHYIREVLTEAIAHRGSSMRNYRDSKGEKGKFSELLMVYAREGESCQVCGKEIMRIVQASRSTFYCRHCQK